MALFIASKVHIKTNLSKSEPPAQSDNTTYEDVDGHKSTHGLETVAGSDKGVNAEGSTYDSIDPSDVRPAVPGQYETLQIE